MTTRPMAESEEIEAKKAGLKFCPECAGYLEQHPNKSNTMSCYHHGDFVLVWIYGGLVVQWRGFDNERV